MKADHPPLETGYSAVPPGKIANMVTCLEMLEPPAADAPGDLGAFRLERWESPDLTAYRTLFRAIGEEWMWVSRLLMKDEVLAETLADPLVETYALKDGDRNVGMVELDFREAGNCEIVYFGLTTDAIGKGTGRRMMEHALSIAWAHDIQRCWLHTCHFDHPGALRFYQKSGFRPYAFMVEVTDDPRLTGAMPRTASPQVPLLDPKG